MSNTSRPILTLKKNSNSATETNDDRTFILDVYHLLLPCRTFQVTYKVAELGKVSLTTEFLLRLIYSVDGMEEDSVAIFFGFNRRELSFVLIEAETHDYVIRKEGRVWLTETGRSLFVDGDSEPKIYNVESRSERVDFDLIALAPEATARLSNFELHLPELQIQNLESISNAADQIRGKAFKRHYLEIATRRDSMALDKRSLYSVDKVTAGERRFSPIQVILRSNADRPSMPEPDLTFWRSDNELEDRMTVMEETAAFLENRKISQSPSDSVAYQVLLELAPDFFKEFTRRDGLAVERYYNEWVGRSGGFRSDRKTVPLVGTIFTPDNYDRLIDGLNLMQTEIKNSLNEFYWLVPQRSWGITNVLPLIIQAIKREAQSGDSNKEFASIAISVEKPFNHIKAAFDKTITSKYSNDPQALELLLIPEVLVVGLVHAPIKCNYGVPAPIGFISIDPQVVRKAQNYIDVRLHEN